MNLGASMYVDTDDMTSRKYVGVVSCQILPLLFSLDSVFTWVESYFTNICTHFICVCLFSYVTLF